MRKSVIYNENQYINNKLVLLKKCVFELKLDTLNNRYFVMNQNNELIYLDELNSKAIVRVGSEKAFIMSFYDNE